MNMDIAYLPIRDILSGELYYTIPDYQRPYSWKEKHVEDFWTDITEAFQRGETGYFLDKLILIKRPGSTDHEVIDGQQRLTTALILLAVLRDFFQEQGLETLAHEIQDDYIKKHGKYRLYTRPEEHAAFEDSVLQEIGALRRVKQSSLPEAFKTAVFVFQKLLEEKGDELRDTGNETSLAQYLENFYRFFLGSVRVIMVVTDNLVSAHTIFETINNRGQELETKDLLKNFLLSRLEEEISRHNAEHPTALKSLDNERNRLLTTWRDIERTHADMDELLRFHHVVTVADKSRSDLFSEITEDIQKAQLSVLAFMNEWKRSVDALDEILSGFWHSNVLTGSSKKALLLLKNIGHTHWVPVLIAAWKQGLGKEEAKKLIFHLERFCGLTLISGYRASAVLFPTIAAVRDLNAGVPLESVLQNRFENFLQKKRIYRDFSEALYGDMFNGNNKGRYALAKYEYALLDDSVTREVLFDKTLQLEHILPQTMTDPSWISIFSKDEHETLVNTLGNLTLLAGSMNEKGKSKNQSASNKPFADKVKIYRGETNRDGLSAFRMTQEVAECPQWTPKVIRERTEIIVSKLLETWNVTREDIEKAQLPVSRAYRSHDEKYDFDDEAPLNEFTQEELEQIDRYKRALEQRFNTKFLDRVDDDGRPKDEKVVGSWIMREKCKEQWYSFFGSKELHGDDTYAEKTHVPFFFFRKSTWFLGDLSVCLIIQTNSNKFSSTIDHLHSQTPFVLWKKGDGTRENLIYLKVDLANSEFVISQLSNTYTALLQIRNEHTADDFKMTETGSQEAKNERPVKDVSRHIPVIL